MHIGYAWEIVGENDEVLTHFGKSVKQYGAQWYQYKELEEKLRFEEGCLVFSETESEIEKNAQNIHKIERFLDFLSHRPNCYCMRHSSKQE